MENKNINTTTNKHDEKIVLEWMIHIATPVNHAIFEFAYNVYADPDYLHIDPYKSLKITLEIPFYGTIILCTNHSNPRIMSVWNDMLDLDIPEKVRMATIIRLMQVTQVFNMKDSLGKWIKEDESNALAGIDPALIKACASAPLQIGQKYGLEYIDEDLSVLAELIQKIDA